MKLYDIYKLQTLEDADHSQEEKYPSSDQEPLKTAMKMGWPPKVGHRAVFGYPERMRLFMTSEVKEVQELEDGYLFKTRNSVYRIKEVHQV